MTPYVIHGLGIQRYGLFLLCGTITSFLQSFDGGIGASMSRYCSVYAATDDRRSATMLATTMGAVVAAGGLVVMTLAFFLAPVILLAFHIPVQLRAEGAVLLRTTAFLIALTQVRAIFGAQLVARQRYALLSLVGIGSYVIYAGGLVISVRGHHGLRGIAVTFAAQAVFTTLLIIPSACRYLVRSGIHLLPWIETKAFLRYSATVQIFGLTGIINQQVDTFVVGALLPVSSVAIYNSGAGFSTQLRGVPVNALAPIATILARSYGSDGAEAAKEQFTYLQRLWVRGVAGWSAAGLGAAYFGVSSWLGPQFRLSGVVAVFLVASNAVNLWTGPLNLLTSAVGKPDLETRYGVVTTVTNLVLTVPLVLAFGLLGTVAATSIAQVAASLYLVRIVHRRYDPGIRSFLKDVPVVPSLITAAFVAGLEFLVRPYTPQGAVGLLTAGVVAIPGLVAYAAIVYGPKRSVAFVRSRLT